MTESLSGTEMPLAIQFCLAFFTVLGLIGAIAWAVSRFDTGRLGGASSRGRPSRISIIDSTSVDRGRRLVLVRRDNIEVLLLIGGPIDVVIETNVIGAVMEPHDVPITRPSAPLLPPPRAIPLLDNGSMQRQPEPATIPRPAPRIEPPPTPAVSPHPSQAETSTRLQPELLAALADNLSNRPPPPRKSLTIITRRPPTELPELRPEPQRDLGIATPQLAGQPATVEFAPTPDEELADLARQLAAALRKPSATVARPSATAARVATAPEQASAAEAVPIPSSPMRALRSPTDARLSTPPARVEPAPAPEQIEAVTISPSPVRVPRPSEPKPPRADANANQRKMLHGSLEQELASLLGRSAKN